MHSTLRAQNVAVPTKVVAGRSRSAQASSRGMVAKANDYKVLSLAHAAGKFMGNRSALARSASVRGNKRAQSVQTVASNAVEISKQPKPVFPFVKIIGQEDMKLGLILNIIDPTLGGVLIMGDRGTAKSMAVRSLAAILPEIQVVKGDAYQSNPESPGEMGPESKAKFLAGESLDSEPRQITVVELPLGATEDRICGTIDIEKALTDGVKAYEPGLLAKANRGILYVDEVNLLEDGLVDVVLDSAASGWNTVEREGVSISHPAKFIMVGSGSEEEGELRPQLLDRFGLNVQVRTIMNVDERTELATARMMFDRNKFEYIASCREESDALTKKLNECRARLTDVKMDPELSLKISEVCSNLNVDGLRGDIVTNRCAKAHAAWCGRTQVTGEDVARVIVMCLSHRLRKDPMDKMDGGYRVVMEYARVFGNSAPKVAATPEAELQALKDKKAAEEAEKAKDAPAEKPKGGAWNPNSLPGRR
uniref:Mg-protoporphyrin IX chelatase n=1 Tax=Pyramimonas obovata TaxID=1411642 RepID=A0A7S0WFY7_9CHLO